MVSKKREMIYLENKKIIDDIKFIVSKKISKRDFIKNDFKKYQNQKDYLSMTLSFLSYISYNNFNAANFLLAEILEMPVKLLSIEIEKKISPNDRSIFKELFIKSLDLVWNSRIDEKLKLMFFQSLALLDDAELKNKTSSFLGQLFVSEVTFSKNDYHYSLKFPNFWISKIPAIEQVEFVQRYFSLPISKDMKIDKFHLFTFFYPQDKNIRELIIERLKKDWKTLSLLEKESVLISLDNLTFKKYLTQENSFFKNSVFNIRKDAYLDIIETDSYGTYGVIRLLELGYEDEDLLSWLL